MLTSKTTPNIADEIKRWRSVNTILVLRGKHPSWGARKLKARLEMLQPDVVWPAASTFGNILSRAGLTSPQKKRKRTTPCSEPFSMVTGPNQLWCMDFKKATS
jgi:transposase InsO family protein